MTNAELADKVDGLSRKFELFTLETKQTTEDFRDRISTIWNDMYGNGKPGIKFCTQTLWEKSLSWDRIKIGIITGVVVMIISVCVNIIVALIIVTK